MRVEGRTKPCDAPSLRRTHRCHRRNDSHNKAIGFSALKTLKGRQNPDLLPDAGDTFHGQSIATAANDEGIAAKEEGIVRLTYHDQSDRMVRLPPGCSVMSAGACFKSHRTSSALPPTTCPSALICRTRQRAPGVGDMRA